MAIHSLCVSCCVALSQLIQDEFGDTALTIACGRGHLETAKLLVHRGAVVNHPRKVRLLLHHIAGDFGEESTLHFGGLSYNS